MSEKILEKIEKIEEKIDKIMEQQGQLISQIREQKTMNNSMVELLNQMMLKDILNDYEVQMKDLVNKVLYADAIEELDSYSKENKIFIDTGAMLTDEVKVFFDNIAFFLKKYGNKIIFPFICFQDGLKIGRENFKMLITSLEKKDLLTKNLESVDSDANKTLKNAIMHFSKEHNVVLITHNKSFAREVLDLNLNKELDKKRINVLKLTKDGFLENIFEEEI